MDLFTIDTVGADELLQRDGLNSSSYRDVSNSVVLGEAESDEDSVENEDSDDDCDYGG